MKEKTIETIKKQGAKYNQYSNEWNVMQQLIDIVSEYPENAEIVFNDLQIKEMNLSVIVSKVVKKRLSNPYEIMKVICDFYKIPTPQTLPPEMWRSTESTAAKPDKHKPIDLLDFL